MKARLIEDQITLLEQFGDEYAQSRQSAVSGSLPRNELLACQFPENCQNPKCGCPGKCFTGHTNKIVLGKRAVCRCVECRDHDACINCGFFPLVKENGKYRCEMCGSRQWPLTFCRLASGVNQLWWVGVSAALVPMCCYVGVSACARGSFCFCFLKRRKYKIKIWQYIKTKYL